MFIVLISSTYVGGLKSRFVNQSVDAVRLVREVACEQLHSQGLGIVRDGQTEAGGDQGGVWGRDACSVAAMVIRSNRADMVRRGGMTGTLEWSVSDGKREQRCKNTATHIEVDSKCPVNVGEID